MMGMMQDHGKAAREMHEAARKLENAQIERMATQIAEIERRIGFDYAGDVSPSRLAGVIEEARSLTARGLPISAALLLLASGDARAREVAYSRELREATDAIEARVKIAQLALAPETWPRPKHADDAATKARAGNLSHTQRAFLATEQAERFKPLRIQTPILDLSRPREPGEAHMINVQVAKREAVETLRAAYVAALILTQAEVSELVWSSALRFYCTLRLDVGTGGLKTLTLQPGGGLRFTAPHLPLGVFRVFVETFKYNYHNTFNEAARAKLAARGAHHVMTSWVHISPAHIARLYALATERTP